MSEKTDLIKLSPLVLYEIATDIQVSEKWKKFAFAVGFSTENVIMIEMSNGDRFPAENVMYHWFSKNPKIHDLAKILCDLDLEKSLYRLKKYVDPDTFQKYEQMLLNNQNNYNNQGNNLDFYEDNIIQNTANIQAVNTPYQTQLSTTSSNNTSIPTTPEAGLISIDLHLPSIPRSTPSDTPEKELSENKAENEENIKEFSNFLLILGQKSTKFPEEEFNDQDDNERFIQGKFAGFFQKQLRGNKFNIQSFCKHKVLKYVKNQKKLYNIIWCLTNFRLYSIPTLIGYCSLDNYLLLVFPNHDSKSLFDILHRTHVSNEIISLGERIMILKVVGEVLSFFHCSVPYVACHGQVNSHNVLVGPNAILLSGFEKFYTRNPDYLKGLENISKPEINIEDYFKRDIYNYLELICETWWNIQPYKKTGHDESLINDIKNMAHPKVKYPDWREESHEKVQKIISQYSTFGKSCPKIEEIVDDLLKAVSSLDPPPYKEMENLDIINGF